jgi:SPP1 family predicted phage head-tail adaptor
MTRGPGRREGMLMLSRLTERATLLARTLAPDGAGGFSESWEPVADIWIARAVVAAADSVLADRAQSRIRHRIVLRRRGDLAAGQRLALGERLFRVHAVRDDGGPYLTLDCEELP